MGECIYIEVIHWMMPSGVTRTSGILSHSSLVGISSPGWRIWPLSASAAAWRESEVHTVSFVRRRSGAVPTRDGAVDLPVKGGGLPKRVG